MILDKILSKLSSLYLKLIINFQKKKKFRLGKNMRKPNTGMIKYLLNKWDIDLKKSLIIGDKNVDKQLAARAGIKFLYVKKEVDLIKNIKSCLKLT